MNYLVLAVITALVAFPQQAHEQALPEAPAGIAQSAAPEILEKIAFCESQGRHFDENGKVLIGGINKHDIGKYQINSLYWRELAERLGYDIEAEEGNEAMAIELYRRYGTAPWKWSKKCWSA
ncbi:hypothetical protein A3G55_03340 [Candidatus Giovannonibacteria bacterium RIFCSPLOWO2_12_FULL_44_25]|uniref:Transglycosylase SLT domain-containing protein n=2 Tax=Candidatus Giovannoniibacteriota TaxID=1752738 RepID=A0A1F5W8M7_9BACT|nr:MAG: hypothetical protein UW15_C0003G0039 [Parcubacteria group bacterium GW2011_GWC1_44_10]KKT60055.1 MAG: hypothetical protein UW53_C0004G0067 [Candidatus Giovannonibacteria bacterium GW2011_GWA1_44_25]KKU30173.1 MAG: hypothetical protein UX43_C0002G0067 [Candidatus Giovannonibacteria bacterium GW2011_GWB1_46_20]OGF49757.1 MAG: hypothetical protein A2120_00410 [Candidatus Giovannonibacteria bacterium GWA2_45_15]OGF59466.1 MAG: hypothetical protein A2W40_03525 [Candidatus Giovannonibacteria 